MPAVRRIVRDAAADGYRLQSIVLGVVKSYPFLMRRLDVAAPPRRRRQSGGAACERGRSIEEMRSMIITKMSLPRRTFLRGVGATIALPFLDAMVPALSAQRQTAAAPMPRLGFFYVPERDVSCRTSTRRETAARTSR